MISKDLVNKYGMRIINEDLPKIRNASNTYMKCKGVVKLNIKYQGINVNVKPIVSNEMQNDMILAWDILKKFRIIPEIFPEPIRQIKEPSGSDICFEKLFDKYEEVFNKDSILKPMKGPPMEIELTNDYVLLYPTSTHSKTTRSICRARFLRES